MVRGGGVRRAPLSSPPADGRQEHDLVDVPRQVVVVGNVHVVVVVIVVIVVVIVVVAVAVGVGDRVGREGDGREDEVEDGEGGAAAAVLTAFLLFLASLLLLPLEDDVIASGADLANN